MRLLLDSHILIWWPAGSPRLGRRAKHLISDEATELLVSAASWWELAIKKSLGRLQIDLGNAASEFKARGVVTLPVTLAHAQAVVDLAPLHGDPFDRMLVAQAAVEGLMLLTRDKRLAAYGAMVLCV